jgi:hypothetical protein
MDLETTFATAQRHRMGVAIFRLSPNPVLAPPGSGWVNNGSRPTLVACLLSP